MIKTGTFVVPGVFLSTVEEFMPGEGAYEENGKVYSSCAGLVLVDLRTRRISVFPAAAPPILKRGDTIIGEVEEVTPQRADVSIEILHGHEGRELPPPRVGTIHVSHTSKSYVRDATKKFRVGDVVRARVLNVGRELVQLSTEGEDLGVIFTKCSRCSTPLEVENQRTGKLKCPICEKVEFRKLARDYRKGVLWGE